MIRESKCVSKHELLNTNTFIKFFSLYVIIIVECAAPSALSETISSQVANYLSDLRAAATRDEIIEL